MEGQKEVLIYTTPTCQYCVKAKSFFNDNNIWYQEFNVAVDIEKRREMVEKSGQMGVPVISINKEIVIGFDENKFRELLEL
ncbi:NrdH-redoxin [Candidatus Nomurabacteria bacterium RIFCSPLOWO2_01_FULL_33_24]|uniref:NrdH-redoxin n=1 Tax=Candidatus Nomurabacteria bacterium RIFCSPLOWO2_01_FULL_33_24 TaxID=1801765 RepID=A0A1F6X2X2_9BACT|nr:MAG: NrdH-redoxin [Candidatus Nomurabacteria bacterium RIFCSPLOWO2_01_FULL_33_24]